jgi:hypothetical protein
MSWIRDSKGTAGIVAGGRGADNAAKLIRTVDISAPRNARKSFGGGKQ